MEGAAGGEKRIAHKIALREDDMLGGIANVAEKAMPPIIERGAETGAARKQFEFVSERIESKIIPPHHDRLRVRFVGGTNLSAIASAGAMNVIVEAPNQIIHDGLHVELSKTA